MVAEVTAPIAAPYASSAGDVQKKSMASLHASEARIGMLLVVPTVIGIVLFTAGPIVASFALSLFKWNVITHPKFVGLANYDALIHD